MSAGYAIPDEPRPSPFNHLVVRPNAPLLAAMLCGGWMTWPWFAFNSIAMGSPTRGKELRMCGVAVAGTVAMAVIVKLLWNGGMLDSVTAARIALLAASTWKLSMAYAVCTVQSRTFAVYEYYGGAVRSATYLLSAGYWIHSVLLGMASGDPFWVIIVLGGW